MSGAAGKETHQSGRETEKRKTVIGQYRLQR